MNEKIGQPGDTKNVNEREATEVTFDAAFEEADDPLLDKKGRQTMLLQGLIEKLPKNILMKESISKEELHQDASEYKGWHGRDRLHVYRLLKSERPDIMKQFGMALLRYANNVDERIVKESDRMTQTSINETIVGEGIDTTCWWTFAPYLYKALIEKGIDPEVALQEIAVWAGQGEDKLRNNLGEQKIKLVGLEKLNKNIEENGYFYILSDDPQGPTHKFTEQFVEKMMDQHSYFKNILQSKES